MKWDVELEDKLSLTEDVLLNGVIERQVRDYKKIEMPVVTFGHISYMGLLLVCLLILQIPTGLTIDPTPELKLSTARVRASNS